MIIIKIIASKRTYKVIKNKRTKKKRNEINCQLVSVKWKINSSPEKWKIKKWSRGVKK